MHLCSCAEIRGSKNGSHNTDPNALQSLLKATPQEFTIAGNREPSEPSTAPYILAYPDTIPKHSNITVAPTYTQRPRSRSLTWLYLTHGSALPGVWGSPKYRGTLTLRNYQLLTTPRCDLFEALEFRKITTMQFSTRPPAILNTCIQIISWEASKMIPYRPQGPVEKMG